MAERKVLVCDVCGKYGQGVTVEPYKVKYPDATQLGLHLCTEHSAPLLKLKVLPAESGEVERITPQPRRRWGIQTID